MNTTHDSAVALASGLKETLGSVDSMDLALLPPAVYLRAVVEAVTGSNLAVGAQNMYFEKKGAFTGELSAAMVRDVGCRYVLLGHSERRHVFGETDEWINKKVRRALSTGLEVIFAVGELLSEREAGQTHDVNKRQVRRGLAGVSSEAMAKVTVAYEPVWAIGTGRTATPDQAQEVHAMIRSLLGELYSPDVAETTRIQYGGSVKPDNAAELLAQADVDGALVGGASLNVSDFTAIVRAGST